MNLVIYIDVLFLLNLVIDYIILSSTGLLCSAKLTRTRVLLASVIGALYSVLIFFPQLRLLSVVLFKITASAIIVLIAFKYISAITYIKQLVVYYILNAAYGGGMYAFYHFTYVGSKMNYSNGIYYIDLPLWQIIILAFIFYFLIKLFTKISDSRVIQKNIRSVSVHFEHTHITVNALFDTGNTLYDPISILPVMLVEADQFNGKLSTSFINYIKQNNSDSLQLLHSIYPNLKLRIIPFHDISGNKNIIYAFKPSMIKDLQTGKEIANTLVGITPAKLSTDMSYNALLHSKNIT